MEMVHNRYLVGGNLWCRLQSTNSETTKQKALELNTFAIRMLVSQKGVLIVNPMETALPKGPFYKLEREQTVSKCVTEPSLAKQIPDMQSRHRRANGIESRQRYPNPGPPTPRTPRETREDPRKYCHRQMCLFKSNPDCRIKICRVGKRKKSE